VLRLAGLSGVFVISGAGALAFETLWFRQARLALGQSVWASSLVLSAFMAGMALGSWLCARHGDRVRNPLRLYGLMELAVAVTGVALVYLLPEFGRAFAPLVAPLADARPVLNLLRLATAFGLLLVPAVAIGATLPLLARAASAWDANFARVLGLLYGANTLGAMLGVLGTELLLIGSLGVRGSALCAGSAALTAAAAAFALARAAPVPVPVPVPEPRSSFLLPKAAPWLAAACLAGFALLALEVVWLRFLSLFLNDTPLAFAVVLATVLAGIALGGLLASYWASLSAHAERSAWLVAYAAGALGLGGYLIYPKFLQGALSPYPSAGAIAAIAAPLVMPTALASGALYTLVGAGLRTATASHAAAAGQLNCANTIGAGIGPLVAGFALLPYAGMELSLPLLFALYGVAGVLLAFATGLPPLARYGGAALFAAVLALFPFGTMRTHYIRASIARWVESADHEVHVRESAIATIVHLVHRAHGAPLFDQIVTNAYAMSTNGWVARRYMKLFVYLPLAIHPRVERALVVGYGMGNTAQALTDSRELRHIDVVDISHDMLEQSRRVRTRAGKSPLDDPRVRTHIEDGRFFLQSTSARYDLITGEPPPPIMTGVVELYTREYFELVRARLSEGGIASYWLPVINISAAAARSVIQGFCGAFPDCSLWHGSARHFVLLGTRDARGPVTAQRFRSQWDDPRVRGELAALGVELPGQLGALFIGDAPYLQKLAAGAEPLVDDRPQLIQERQERAERDALLREWRDTRAARERFAQSALIGSLWPASERAQALPQFDAQHVINELTFPEPTALRHSRALHGLLFGTPLRLPVLLLLGSDPDHQRALARLSARERERPEWLLHRAAGHLADRDLRAASALLERMPPERLPLPDLREYVAYAIERRAAPATAADSAVP
jgi:predicted membrane-bound spermidine synthase